MTVAEIERTELGAETDNAQRLAMARNRLGSVLQQGASEQAYTHAAVDYLNAFSDEYFNYSEPRFSSYSEIAVLLYQEMSDIAPRSSYCVTDIENQLRGYTTDGTATHLQANKHNVLPRACTLTLLNILNMQHPFRAKD